VSGWPYRLLGCLVAAVLGVGCVDVQLVGVTEDPPDRVIGNGPFRGEPCAGVAAVTRGRVDLATVYRGLPSLELHYWRLRYGDADLPIINTASSIHCGSLDSLPLAGYGAVRAENIEWWLYSQSQNGLTAYEVEEYFASSRINVSQAIDRLGNHSIRFIIANVCADKERNSFSFAGRAVADRLTLRAVVATSCPSPAAEEEDAIEYWVGAMLHEAFHVHHRVRGWLGGGREDAVASEIVAHAASAEFLDQRVVAGGLSPGAFCRFVRNSEHWQVGAEPIMGSAARDEIRLDALSPQFREAFAELADRLGAYTVDQMTTDQAIALLDQGQERVFQVARHMAREC